MVTSGRRHRHRHVATPIRNHKVIPKWNGNRKRRGDLKPSNIQTHSESRATFGFKCSTWNIRRGTWRDHSRNVPRGTFLLHLELMSVPRGTSGGFPLSGSRSPVEEWCLYSCKSLSLQRMSLLVRCTEICRCKLSAVRPILQASLRFSKN